MFETAGYPSRGAFISETAALNLSCRLDAWQVLTTRNSGPGSAHRVFFMASRWDMALFGIELKLSHLNSSWDHLPLRDMAG